MQNRNPHLDLSYIVFALYRRQYDPLETIQFPVILLNGSTSKFKDSVFKSKGFLFTKIVPVRDFLNIVE